MEINKKGLCSLEELCRISGYSDDQILGLVPSEHLEIQGGKVFVTKHALVTLMLSNNNEFGVVKL